VQLSRLTIVGGVRERSVVTRRGRGKTVCARGAYWALLCSPSTSPLERGTKAPLREKAIWFLADGGYFCRSLEHLLQIWDARATTLAESLSTTA